MKFQTLVKAPAAPCLRRSMSQRASYFCSLITMIIIETRCIKRQRWPYLRSVFSLWAILFLEYCCWRCSSMVAAFEAPLCRPTSCFVVGGCRCHTSTVTAGGKLKLENHWWKKYSEKRVSMLASAKAKRVKPGRPSQRKSVGKKARRILEPASPEEVSSSFRDADG